MTMNRARCSMFAACVMFTLARVATTAQLGTPPDRPWSINVFVDEKGISVQNSSPTQDRQKVWARAGGTVTFVVENRDTVAHTVRIPIDRFLPSQKYQHKGPGDPMQPRQRDNVTVKAGEVRLLVLRVKSPEHFPFKTREPWSKDSTLGMTYKYDVYSKTSEGKTFDLDPDIEIQRP